MKSLVLLFSIMLLILSSCSRVTLVRREHWDGLMMKLDTLQTTMAKLDSSIAVRDENALAYQLEQEFATLRIEEQISQISRNISESQTMIHEIGKKTGKISEQIQGQSARDSSKAAQAAETKNALFIYGLKEFQSGRFAQAQGIFKEYMQTYPSDNRFHEALYWRGESALGQKDYPAAEELFKQYYSSYRDGELICAVLFKWGNLYQEIEEIARRDYVWKQLLDICPNSQEASLVSARMQQ